MEICAQVIKNAAGCGSTAAVKHCIRARLSTVLTYSLPAIVIL
jgi:hypothetical protein